MQQCEHVLSQHFMGQGGIGTGDAPEALGPIKAEQVKLRFRKKIMNDTQTVEINAAPAAHFKILTKTYPPIKCTQVFLLFFSSLCF